jgi:hypothetical protein
VVIGFAGLSNGDSLDQYGSNSMIAGCVMVFVSLFAQGMQLIIEEHVLKNYQ